MSLKGIPLDGVMLILLKVHLSFRIGNKELFVSSTWNNGLSNRRVLSDQIPRCWLGQVIRPDLVVDLELVHQLLRATSILGHVFMVRRVVRWRHPHAATSVGAIQEVFTTDIECS